MANGLETRLLEILKDPEAVALQADLAQAAALRRQEQAHRQRLGAAAARLRRAEELGLTEAEIAEARADIARRETRLAAATLRAEAADIRRPVPDKDRAQVFARIEGAAEAPPATLAALSPEGEVVARAAAGETGFAHLSVEGALQDVTLQVSDARGRVLYRAAEPVTVEPGTVAYLEVMLGAPDPEPGPVPKQPKMPDLVGQSEGVALAILKRIGAPEPTIEDKVAEGPPDIVLAQKPEKGAALSGDTQITLVVRRTRGGTVARFMPGLIGLTLAEAEKWLKELDLPFEVSRKQSERAADIVLDQAPDEGSPLKEVTGAKLVVSAGPGDSPGRVRLPDLRGKSLADATEILTALELRVKSRETQDPDLPAGVVDQAPEPGTIVERGSTVALAVNLPPAPAPGRVVVPNVVGQTEGDASARLREIGLAPSTTTQADRTPRGQVFAQDPAGGQRVQPGAKVVLLVSTGPRVRGGTLTALVRAMEADPRTEEEGLNAARIGRLFDAAGVADRAGAEALAEQEVAEVRDAARLPSLKVAQRFRAILRQALKATEP